MDTDALVETLESAGLSPYQAEAYVALLDLGVASATNVAEAGNVPTPRIYDVLRSLEERGYVETYEQGSLRARAHSPSGVLQDLRGRADRLEAAAEEVEDRWEQPELEGSEASIVKRFRTVIERARTFVEDASHQVLLSTTPKNFERLAPALRDAHDRGVSVRVSVHTEDPDETPGAATFDGVCLEVRHRPLPAPFVVLADRRKASFAHHPNSYDQYGVLLNDRTHTFVFYWYFLTCLWDPWDVLYEATKPGLPAEYLDIRYCVRDLRRLEEVRSATLLVEGYDVATGEAVEVEGSVIGIRTPFSSGESTDLHEMAGQVTLDLETDDGSVSVGGWGAILEDVESTRISLLDAGALRDGTT